MKWLFLIRIKFLDDKEMKKRFFKKYGYEMKDDEDF